MNLGASLEPGVGAQPVHGDRCGAGLAAVVADEDIRLTGVLVSRGGNRNTAVATGCRDQGARQARVRPVHPPLAGGCSKASTSCEHVVKRSCEAAGVPDCVRGGADAGDGKSVQPPRRVAGVLLVREQVLVDRLRDRAQPVAAHKTCRVLRVRHGVITEMPVQHVRHRAVSLGLPEELVQPSVVVAAVGGPDDQRRWTEPADLSDRGVPHLEVLRAVDATLPEAGAVRSFQMSYATFHTGRFEHPRPPDR
jgi:hypothetical protein